MDTERRVLNTGVYWVEMGRASGRGRWGGITWGEMPDVDEGRIETANHLVIHAPMQQPYVTCTCIPETKVKKRKVGILVLF